MVKKRINKCIELLEQGEILYGELASRSDYIHAGNGELTYKNGLEQAKTWADFLITDFEHYSFDITGLTNFMRGLVDGGPTRSGHRTPTVISNLPSNARTASEVHANAWQIRQVLSAGVHGILHTHPRQADAVRAFVESCRYPFQTIGVGKGLGEGQRGAGGQGLPSEIWGIDSRDYVKIADPWPLNPDGELLLGLKLEDRECVANADHIASTPGLAFAEWGPGDMGMSYGYEDAHDPPYPAELENARHAIKKACDDNGLFFLSSWHDKSLSEKENIQFLLDWGVRIISGSGESGASIGRSITGRSMPV